jgi:hypothetical protein
MVGVIEVKKELWLDDEALVTWKDFQCLLNDIIANNPDDSGDFFEVRTILDSIEVDYGLNIIRED